MVRRLSQGLLALFIAVTIAFFLMYVIGDPVLMLIGEEADAASVEALRQLYGYDRPIHVQYLSFVGGIVQGDWGSSLRFRLPVLPLMFERLVVSAELAIPAFTIAAVVAIVAGTMSAQYRNRWGDYLARGFALFGQSAPTFWVAIMLIVVFGVRLHWLPASGRGGWEHMVLPVITLSLWPTAYLTRLIRSSVLDLLHDDMVRTARGKGLPGSQVLFKHVLRNAMIPFITVGAMKFATMLSGSMIVETIFNYPGFGRLMLNSIRQFDVPLVAGTIMMTAILVVVMNLVADVLYVVIDPRVRLN